MSLVYDPQELRLAVETLFSHLARTHPDPEIAGIEQSIVVAKVHEHSSLEDALADSQKGDNVKPRVVIVSHAIRSANGQPVFYVRKGRENRDRSVQIGRTWGLETMSSLDVPPEQPNILIVGFKKPYYWVFGSPEIRQNFELTLRDVYFRYTNKLVPSLLPPPKVPDVSRRRTVSGQHRQHQADGNSRQPTQASMGSHTSPQIASQERQAIPQPAPQPAPQMYSPNMAGQPATMAPQATQAAQASKTQTFSENQAVSPLTAHTGQQTREQEPDGSVQRSASNKDAPVPPTHTVMRKQSPESLSHAESNIPQQSLPPLSERAQPDDAAAPTPPPHSSAIPDQRDESIGQTQSVAPLRNVQNHSGPEIPTRAPTRSSRSRINGRSRTSNQPLPDNGVAVSQSRGNGSPETASTTFARSRSFATPPPAAQTSDNTQDMQKSSKALDPPVAFSPPQSQSTYNQPSSPERGSSAGQSLQFSPLRSPANAASHRRSLSSTLGGLSSKPANRELQDLATVIDEFRWTGTNISDLERSIRDRLDQISYQNFSGIVNLDSQLDEINVCVKKSIDECNRVDSKMQAVAMNLVGKGDDMTHMEGRSDNLQILALNYRKLAMEIEKLLDVSRLDDSFVSQLYNVNFGDPNSSKTPILLHHIEEMLMDLSQALEMFYHHAGSDDRSATTMQAFQEPRRTAQSLALNVATNFEKFIEYHLKELFSNAPSADSRFSDSLEFILFSKLYIYTGCVLFIRDTASNVHGSILRQYEKEARKAYTTGFTRSVRNWTNKLDQLVSKEASGSQRQALHGNNGIVPASLPMQPQVRKMSSNGLQELHSLFSSIADSLCMRVAGQQCFLEKFFHLGSEAGHKFATFASQEEPLPARRVDSERATVHDLEKMTYLISGASKSSTAEVLNAMQNQIFPQLGDTIGLAVTKMFELRPFESAYLALVLDIRSYEMRRTNQQFLAALLAKLQKQMADSWDEVSRNYTRKILNAHFTTKKRVGVHPVVAEFTELVSIVETSFSAALSAEIKRRQQLGIRDQTLITYEGDTTRQTIDQSHGNMFRAIAQGLRMGAATSEIQGGNITAAARLKAAARETAGGGGSGEETKELLNRHVVMIENLYRIYTDLERFGSVGVQSIVLDAKQHYQRELDSYIADVISRPLGKIVAFVNQHEARSTHHVKQKESVSAMKRVVKGYDVRELRSGVEQLRKRVEKHFTGSDPAVLSSVWNALRTEYLNVYTRLTRIAQNLDAMNYIDIQKGDILNAFN